MTELLTHRCLSQMGLLAETVEYYRANPRAIRGSRSMWTTPDGGVCTVGRCMIDPGAVSESSVEDLECRGDPNWDHLLKPEYRGWGVGFWLSMEFLHDSQVFWSQTEEGWELTTQGWNYIDEMMDDIFDEYQYLMKQKQELDRDND